MSDWPTVDPAGRFRVEVDAVPADVRRQQERHLSITRVHFQHRPWWRRVSVSIAFEPRDLWVGAYLGEVRGGWQDLYVCIVPTLPIRFRLQGR